MMLDLLKSHRRSLVVILTPLLLLFLLPFYEQIGITQRACNCLYMLLLMAVYWCTEVIPLPVTALIPLALAPSMGILEASTVSKSYFRDKIVLMFGSLILAAAIQHTGLHRRIALTFMKLFGTTPRLLMLGFMVPTWLLSMWISNTATAVMMVSIVNCVIAKLDEFDQENEIDGLPLQPRVLENGDESDTSSLEPEKPDVEIAIEGAKEGKRNGKSPKRFDSMAKSLCLAVCYSSTCGGVATLTGTGTNLIFYENAVDVGERLNYDFGINLPKWISFALPISILLLIICWVWLQIIFVNCQKKNSRAEEDREIIAQIINSEYSSLGAMSWRELVTVVHFIALVVLWLGRNPGKAGGWSQLFHKGFVTDATATMLVSLSIMFMPKYPPMIFRRVTSRPFEPLMPWKSVSETLPWGVLFLLAGGLALADCVNKSGLSDAIANSLRVLSDLPVWALILILCAITAGITEFSSNVVIGALVLPIVGDMAISMEIHPLSLMIPCCVAASFAFMLPVATPPNAVVYAAGVLRIKDMVMTGAFLNVIAVLITLLASVTWGPLVFDFSNFNYNTTTLLGNITANSSEISV